MLSLNILKFFITELEFTQLLTITPQHTLNLCKKSLENLSKKLLPDHEHGLRVKMNRDYAQNEQRLRLIVNTFLVIA
jgi:hypothetical protein